MQETQEMRVQSLGWEDPLEKETATHSSILAWRIPRTEESGGLQSTGSKELDTTEAHVSVGRKPNFWWRALGWLLINSEHQLAQQRMKKLFGWTTHSSLQMTLAPTTIWLLLHDRPQRELSYWAQNNER